MNWLNEVDFQVNKSIEDIKVLMRGFKNEFAKAGLDRLVSPPALRVSIRTITAHWFTGSHGDDYMISLHIRDGASCAVFYSKNESRDLTRDEFFAQIPQEYRADRDADIAAITGDV